MVKGLNCTGTFAGGEFNISGLLRLDEGIRYYHGRVGQVTSILAHQKSEG